MSRTPEPDAEDLLAEFVGYDTVSANGNKSFVDRLEELVEAPAVRIERAADAGGKKVELLVATGPEPTARQGNGRRPGLILSGHTDTVPADEPEWSSDPFTATDAGDRWVGRGTSDMKGFLALAVAAFRRARSEKLRAPLVLLFTSDEELGSLGAQRLAAELQRSGRADTLPRAAIIGEPTSLKVVHRHKGHYRLRLTLLGKAAHSGFPQRGVSAIERAGTAIRALSELEALWAADPERRDAGLETPHQTLNLGTIAGGRAVNVIPDRCVLEIGIRPLPGIAGAELGGEVEATLARALPPADGRAPWRLEEVNDSPSLLTPADAPIHARLRRELGQPAPIGTSFASDAGVFQSLGMESVLFGPGSIEVAHKPNEFLPKDEFFRAGVVLDAMIDAFCRQSATEAG